MFGKKKNEPPMNKLREIYNELANSSLSNLSLEQNGHLKEALIGWKNLHFQAESKLEKLNDDISDQLLTDEESFLFDEIHILKAQADDNMMRLNRSLEQTARRKKQQLLAKQQNALNSASPSPNVPTLRSNIPTTMNSKKNSSKPMMKSLRSGGGGNLSNYSNANGSSSNITNNIPNSSTSSVSSTSAKHAANMIWSPSTSLTTGKSSNVYNDDQFTDFATDYGEYYQQETLKQLQHQGQSSKNYRANSPTSPYDSQDDSDFTDQFQSSLKITKQQQLMNRKPSPSDRAKAALKASAAVKYPTRPTQRSANKNRSPVRQTKSSTQKKSKSNNRKESPSRVPILSDSQKDTETLDNDSTSDEDISDDEKLIRSLKGVDPTAAKQILNEIVVKGDEVHWDDIAGLETAKKSLKETVVYPFLRPDLFRGLREPASGMLLFGPPGTGKTMLARAVATESESTFFSIQASSLTSKYLGESEKLVRALFQVAKARAPSIIFVDEIDSLLGTRSNEGENESSRRIKNEFLVQWSDLTKAAAGRDSGEEMQRVLVLAATNLPWGIDEAARRRFVRRQYIPLPEAETRKAQFVKLLSHQIHTLTEKQLDELIDLSEGFSGSDITALAKDAAMGPLRELGDKLLSTNKSEIRPLGLVDFINSLKYIRPSVSQNSLKQFEDWAKNYGSSGV